MCFFVALSIFCLYIDGMSERLRDLVETYLIRMGRRAEVKLAAEAELSPSTIRNVRNGHIPSPETTYRIALACGLTPEEALLIAKECSLERARETA